MAKPIKKSTGSNFDRFLKPEIVAQVSKPSAKAAKAKKKSTDKVLPLKKATKKTEARVTTEAPEIQVLEDEIADKRRDFSLTRNTHKELEDIIRILRDETGENVSRSQLLRSIIRTLSTKKEELREEASKLQSLKRPANARGNEADMVEFEEEIGEALRKALC